MTLAAGSPAAAPRRAGWTGQLWAGIEGSYAAILGHPFIRGLTTGDLPPEAFFYYLSQDDHYVREFAKAVAQVGIKAPTAAAARLLTRHAADGLTAESTLHQVLVADLGGDPAALAKVQPGPTTQAYTSYVLATAAAGDFAEGLAAVLPCLWIYGEVGQHLHGQGSPNPVYQRWIDTYAGPEYASQVTEVLDLADQAGSELAGPAAERAQRHFSMGARYEWMFWDAAWRRESWPL
jgi:thiaminase (transcriptional activator TenA)